MAANFGGDGVEGGGAKVFYFDVEGTEVGDQGVFESAAEGVGSGYDFERTSADGRLGHGGEVREVQTESRERVFGRVIY